MKTLFWLFLSVGLSAPAYAQVKGASAAEGACNVGNAENIGQHIIDWVLCGASFSNPGNTLFGALSLVLNVTALSISIYMFLFNGLKWVYFTTEYGVPGGNNGKIHGGIVVLRMGLLLSLLAPIVGNGFSPIQVAMRNFTEMGKSFGDLGANSTANFIAVEGAMTNVDLQNIEKTTAQIIASTMCGKLFDAHHQTDISNGLIEKGTRTVIPITTAKGTDVSIKWSYIDALRNGGYVYNWAGSSAGICGEITLKIPDILKNNDETKMWHPGGSVDILVIDTPEHLRGYADLVINQYKAVKDHIKNVESILDNTVADVITIIDASAAKAKQDASLISQIDAAHKMELSLSQQIDENMPQFVADLVAANTLYHHSILKVGSGAAKLVNTTDNVVSPDCGGSKPDLTSTLDNNIKSIEICTPGESWQSQLERQGFAALGLYYMVHLKINQKILDLQSHLLEPGNRVPFYEDFDNIASHNVFESIARSDASSKIYDRYYLLMSNFMQVAEATSFNMNFSAVENTGNTVAESENRNGLMRWLGSIFESATSSITKFLGSKIVSKNGGGDLILNLMSLGALLLNTSHILLGIITGAALISLFPASRLFKVFSKFSKGKSKGSGSDNKDAEAQGGMSIVWTIFLGTYVLGSLLFFGLPAIPLLKWVLEIQSWAIMMFLAFIYAPLWVMAHASITDDRFMAEHTQAGYGMVYELLLRPLLMVVSFFAMIKLMYISDIGFTMMMSYLIGIGSTGFTGLGFVAILIISIFTAIQLCFRCFDLISLIPDYVIARIGFGAKPLGDVANDKSHSTLMMGAFRTGGKGLHSGASGVMMGVASKMGLTESKEGLNKPKS